MKRIYLWWIRRRIRAAIDEISHVKAIASATDIPNEFYWFAEDAENLLRCMKHFTRRTK